MPKAVKIDVCGVMTEVDNMFADEDYRKMKTHDSWALHVPMKWQPSFRLSLVCKGIFEEDDDFNLTASFLYYHLYSNNGKPSSGIVETVWITNEDENGLVDLTVQEVRSILEKVKQ